MFKLALSGNEDSKEIFISLQYFEDERELSSIPGSTFPAHGLLEIFREGRFAKKKSFASFI
jgi:hypothetical protein